MRFSITISTRNRLQLLIELLKSIEEKTLNKDEVEVLVIGDDDDSKLVNSSLTKDFNINLYLQKRNPHINNGYNFLCSKAKGKYIFHLNDDCEIITQDWDEIIFNKAEEYLKDKEDRIVYIKLNDGSSEIGWFPILSKECIEELGFFLNPDYYSWVADKNLFQIYSSINRILNINVEVLHKSHHTGERERDETNIQLEENTALYHPPSHDTVTEHVNKLEKRISECTKKNRM